MGQYAFELGEIDVNKIEANPSNPRGQFVRDNDDQFLYLKRSIKEFGLIVPIVVRERPDNDEKPYLLLDGERRYFAVKELGIKKVHAHILKSFIDDETSKNLMFHVHTNRSQWEAHQQCKALEPLYGKLSEQFSDEVSIARELVVLTGTNKRTINARLNFLRWPISIKQLVYTEKPDLYYTVVEIESQIIVPAQKNFPSYFKNVSVDEVREFLIRKYLEKTVHAATEARKASVVVRTVLADKAKHTLALKLLRKMVNEVDYTFENARDDFIAEFPDAADNYSASFKAVTNDIKRVTKTLQDLESRLPGRLDKSQKQKMVSLLDELKSAVANALSTDALG